MRFIFDYNHVNGIINKGFIKTTEQLTGISLEEIRKAEPVEEAHRIIVTMSYGMFQANAKIILQEESAKAILLRMNKGKLLKPEDEDDYLREYGNIVFGRIVSAVNDYCKKASRFYSPIINPMEESEWDKRKHTREEKLYYQSEYGRIGLDIGYTIDENRGDDMNKVLIIDDSPFIIKEVGQICEEHGYKVVGRCKSGEDGIERFKETNPDVVTLDIVMPGMDGIETATAIKEIDPNARIIMLSSLCDYDTLEEVQKLGISRLVPKPVDEKDLLSALESILREI